MPSQERHSPKKSQQTVKIHDILPVLSRSRIKVLNSDFDPESEIFSISEPFPGQEKSISFVKGDRYPALVRASLSSLVFIPEGFSKNLHSGFSSFIETPQPRLAFAVAADLLSRRGELVSPEEVKVSNSASLLPGAVLLGSVEIGDGTVIGGGSVIGRQGFGFERLFTGEPVRIPHVGIVQIGKHVEIGANCTVDRGTFRSTNIGNYSKLDNQVNISHNVEVGENCLIAAGARVTGGAIIEDNVWIGPNAVISNGVRVGAGAHVSIGSVVLTDVPADSKVFGNPARILR